MPNESFTDAQDLTDAQQMIQDHLGRSWNVAVQKWWSEYVNNSPIARNTEALNYLGQVIHKLKPLL